MVSILIDCQPFLLGQIVSHVLGQLPGVKLVAPGTGIVDIVVKTPPTDPNRGVDGPDQPWARFGLVTLDGPSNTLWVRDTTSKGIGQRILLGDLANLVTVTEKMVTTISRERVTRTWQIA